MEIIIGKTAGFCYGVKNAVTKTLEEAKKTNSNIQLYCLGELVHNRQVITELEQVGVKIINDLQEIENDEKGKTVIIRAHGVIPKIYQEIQAHGYKQIDLTCPNVLAIHKLVEQMSKDNTYILLIGNKEHPEVIGTYGFCDKGYIIETEEDINIAIDNFEKTKMQKLAIVAQTTFSLEKFNKIVNKIQEMMECKEIDLKIKNTICNATKLRQDETEKLSREVDVMIIIGGENSSNTRKLYDISKKNCEYSICIENASQLDLTNIVQLKQNKTEGLKIGIMAGASTPHESIEEVKKLLENIELNDKKERICLKY